MTSINKAQVFTLPAGSVVKVSGMPYELLSDTSVSGFHEPEFFVSGDGRSLGGSSEPAGSSDRSESVDA